MLYAKRNMVSPEDLKILKQDAKDIKLVYTNDSQPGYTRKLTGKKFAYYNADGKKITDKEIVQRIKALVIPPAWTKVWISPKINGHLQVTGYDTAGRKQYKYHAKWSAMRNERKHNRMAEFGKSLPKLRKQVRTDLRKKGMVKDKVVAMAIAVMDKTFIRIGNSAYTRLYGSYGLTSLRDKHVKINGDKLEIIFKGKKGVQQEIKLTHGRLARILKKLKDIPGQELFQYYDSEGKRHALDSGLINEYINEHTGNNFTAKDFRTWWGTVTAASFLAQTEPCENKTQTAKTIVATLDFVARKLGNTRTVCKKYYVHPKLLEEFETGELDKYLDKFRHIKRSPGSPIIKAEEKIIMEFIIKECAKK
jgi:DNA topoisomerase-1